MTSVANSAGTSDSEPNFGQVDNPEIAHQANPEPPESDEAGRKGGETLTREELDKILKERDAEHAKQLAAARTGFPAAMVHANAGGPGTDNHQASWSQAEQEAAVRGEILDHWDVQE